MLRWILALAWVGPIVLAVEARQPPNVPPPGTPKKEPIGDLDAGRPLPKGTLARLGSPRLRSRSDYSHGMQFSPDGKLLVLAASRDELWWYDLATGKTLHHAEYPVGGIQSGRLLDGGALLFFHSKTESDNSRHFISRFDPKSGKVVSETKIEIASVDHSEFDGPGARLLVQREKTVSVHDAASGAKLWSETLDRKPSTPPTIAPDGSVVVVGTDRALALFDGATGKRLRVLDPPPEARSAGASGLIASADGRWIAGNLRQECVVVWDARTGRPQPVLPRQKLALGFAPNSRLFTVAETGTVVVWNVADQKREREFPIPVADRAALAPDGKRIATRVHDCVALHDLPAEGLPTLAPISADLPGLPDELHFAPDGALVGRLPEYGGWAVWTHGEATATLLRPPGTDTVIGLARDRRTVLTAAEGRFAISNLTGDSPAKFKFDLSTSGLKRLAALAADGRVAIAVHEEGLARYDMNTRTQQVLRSRFANRGAGTVAAIADDGRLAATEGYDPATDARHVEIFSLGTNRPVRELPVRGPADRMAFVPDGRRLAVAFITTTRDGDQQKNLLVVEPESGRELLRVGPLPNGSGPRMAMAPDGRTVAWAVEHEVRVYELLTGQLRGRFAAPQLEAHAVALAGDGRTVAVAGAGWPVILWDLSGESEPAALQPEEWDGAWRDLAGTDTAKAYRSARRMRRTPAEAVRFLAGRLKPAAAPDGAALARSVAALDAPAFADRQKASKDLRALGELAIPELTRVLESTDSAEVRERIETLLKQGHKPTPEAIRAVRAVELLEWLRTPDARSLLLALAGGAEGAIQTREAIAARDRTK
jgi:PQQ-like domain